MPNVPVLLIISSLIVITLSLAVFFAFPQAVDTLAFSGETFFAGELWRLLTFPFVHVNLSHLLENIAALVIITILGFQMGLNGKQFLACFVGASLLIAITEAPLLPTLLIAGASVGILSVSGFLSLRGKKYIPAFILIPLFILPVVFQFIFNIFRQGTSFILTMGLLLHIAGFVLGILFFFARRLLRKDRSILQGTSL